jgi:hypothetical protein
MVLISNPRRFCPLMAQSSFKMKIVGTAARLLHSSKLDTHTHTHTHTHRLIPFAKRLFLFVVWY